MKNTEISKTERINIWFYEYTYWLLKEEQNKDIRTRELMAISYVGMLDTSLLL